MQVTAIFGTSMEVMISVCGERLAESSIFHCGDAYATVVSVDQHGLPVDIPFELKAKDPADQQRCSAARNRWEWAGGEDRQHLFAHSLSDSGSAA